ncbi:hypothetical protein BOTBODRAFT_39096 [Botryobasidium botryosum FD-172 SS1]|uniref:GYF domain-containing protein n=1 Tax=Botryobasidium botryosum (strain FD-172 SS1) TaxID=930990 RepID=A0A067LV82_BOTB1|nr:hypothetical protein BOTBODRAFT_39096 [Botryobasidium botryosum FD-172 SS1]
MSKQKRSPAEKGAGSSSKRLRFVDSADAPSDEQSFDAHVLDTLETPLSTRKGAVKTEGYESDSSDDGEGVVNSRKRDDAEEEDDMFALEQTEKSEAPKGGKKKYLALGDIEGQEFGDEGDSDSDNSDVPEDMDEVERKKKKGMGFEISSFNMKAEMEEGKFTEDGSYVRSFDPHAVHDRWMEDMDERAVKKARKNKKRMEERERAKISKEAGEARRAEDITHELLGLLQKGETVLEALRRFGKEKNQGGAVERLTDLASSLMSLGNLDIYEEPYESLVRTVHRAGLTPPPPSSSTSNQPSDTKPASAPSAQYEYRWSPSYLSAVGHNDSGEIFGPYERDAMMAWRSASYFGEGGERVQVRKVGDTAWGGWETVV